MGDVEWKRGNTKLALEWWEAAICTCHEFSSAVLALNLYTTVVQKQLPQIYALFDEYSDVPWHQNLRRQEKRTVDHAKAVWGNLAKEIANVLGWDPGVLLNDYRFAEPNFWRDVEAACLKLITRRAQQTN